MHITHEADFEGNTNFKAGDLVTVKGHRTEVRLVKPGNLTVMKGPKSYHVGYGTHFTVKGELTGFRATADGSHTVNSLGKTIEGKRLPSLTNLNKLEGQSAEVQEVTVAIRQMRRERRLLQEDMRRATLERERQLGHRETPPPGRGEHDDETNPPGNPQADPPAAASAPAETPAE